MADGAVDHLATRPELRNVPIEIESKRERDDNTVSAGSGIVLWAELDGGGIIGGSNLGKKGVALGKTGAAASKVGKEAAEELLRGLAADGCVDEVSFSHSHQRKDKSLELTMRIVSTRSNYHSNGSG